MYYETAKFGNWYNMRFMKILTGNLTEDVLIEENKILAGEEMEIQLRVLTSQCYSFTFMYGRQKYN